GSEFVPAGCALAECLAQTGIATRAASAATAGRLRASNLRRKFFIGRALYTRRARRGVRGISVRVRQVFWEDPHPLKAEGAAPRIMLGSMRFTLRIGNSEEELFLFFFAFFLKDGGGGYGVVVVEAQEADTLRGTAGFANFAGVD